MVRNMYRQALTLGLAMLLTGCGLFGKDKLEIDGERINVIKETADLAPDYAPGEVKIKLPAPYTNNQWSQSGGNAMHLMGHLEADSKLKEIWDSNFGEGSSKRDFLIASPIIAYKVVFAIDADGIVSAYRLDDGRKIWKKRLKALNKDDNSVAMKGAGLAEFNQENLCHNRVWRRILPGYDNRQRAMAQGFRAPIRIAPTVGANRVFVQTFDNTLIALNAESGEEIWKITNDFENTTLVGGASPAYNPDLDVVIAAFSNGELRAFKASTGTPLWVDLLVSKKRTNSLSNITAIKANPVIDGDRVYAVGYNSILAAIDLRTGARVWEKELGSNNQPWIAGDYLYVLTNDFDLLAFEKNSGKIVWNTSIPYGDELEDRSGVFGSGPLLAENRLIVATSNGYVFAVSPYTGEILSYISIDDGVELAPIMAHGITLFTTKDADMLAFQ